MIILILLFIGIAWEYWQELRHIPISFCNEELKFLTEPKGSKTAGLRSNRKLKAIMIGETVTDEVMDAKYDLTNDLQTPLHPIDCHNSMPSR